MGSVPDPHDISRVFDDEVLQTPASANKRDVLFSRVLNAQQRAVETFVRTARTAKQSVELSKRLRLIGGKPSGLEMPAQRLTSMFNAPIRGNVCRVLWIEITDDADPRSVRHLVRIGLTYRCVKSIDGIPGMNKFEPSVSSLRLVLRIVQAGKLTSAASQSHMSQSAASHALGVFESQVGAQLFLRERNGLRLSEVGQKLLPRIESALSSLDAIRAEIANLAMLETGNLRIAAVPSVLATILPPILREYTVRFPGVELSVFEGTDDEVQMWVQSGLSHVGFAALPIDGVVAEEVAQDEWLALVRAGRFSGKTAISLRELARHKFLMSGGGCERHILRIFASAGIRIAEPLTVKQMPTIQAMVAEDLGVSLVPRLSVCGARGCRMLALKPRRFRKIGMVRSANSPSTPALEAWLSLARISLKHSAPPAIKSPTAGR
jgi:DNA-binding transcriptional LysR family regulator